MRALDVPAETIRDIVIADVNKLYDSRKREILKDTIQDEFWKSEGQGRFVDQKHVGALHSLGEEKETVLRELLGVHTGAD